MGGHHGPVVFVWQRYPADGVSAGGLLLLAGVAEVWVHWLDPNGICCPSSNKLELSIKQTPRQL